MSGNLLPLGAAKASELDHKQTCLRQEAIAGEIDRLAVKPTLTSEEETRWAELNDEFDELDLHRKNLERAADIAKIRSVMDRPTVPGQVEEGWAQAPVRTGMGNNFQDYDRDSFGEPESVENIRWDARNPWDVSNVREWGRDRNSIASEMRARAMSAIDKMPVANDAVRKAATHLIERFDDSDSKLARLCLATSSPQYMRAWSKLARGAGHELSRAEQEAIAYAKQATRAMSLTDSAGGYLVPFQLDPTVIITSAGSLNQIRRVARQVVAIGDVWNGVSAGAVTWAFAAEATESSDNAPTFAQPSINVHKAQGFVPISIEAIEDEANVAAEVARLLAFGRDTLEATKFITGTGTNEPIGIVTALNGSASNVESATDNTFAIGDIYKLDNALPARYRMNSSWLAHRAIYNAVRGFDTAGVAGLWVQLPNDVPAQMLGRPAYEAEAMASTPTTDQADILIYGDFQHYVIADRIGMTVEFIPHLVGSNRRPTGQRGWYAYYRVGADSVNDDAFRMLEVN
jgi:HK97 family phage major capsid protein